MNDVIELELITSGEAECLHKMQVEAFIALYEKYRDDENADSDIKELLLEIADHEAQIDEMEEMIQKIKDEGR